MGNTTSIRNLSAPAIADYLVKQNTAFQPFAEKLFTGDDYLALVDGNYLLSLNLDKPSDAEAFDSIMETLNVKPLFLRKCLENLLVGAQQRSSVSFDPPRDTSTKEQAHLQPSEIENTTKLVPQNRDPVPRQIEESHKNVRQGTAAPPTSGRSFAQVAAAPAASVVPPSKSSLDTHMQSFVSHEGPQGKRLFVRGLPPMATRDDIKDHFGSAGHVVYVSVSRTTHHDPSGETTRCGIVEYETAQMAQRAAFTMSNLPMEGYKLFVRPDAKEGVSTPAEQSRTNTVLVLCTCCADAAEKTIDGVWVESGTLKEKVQRALNLPSTNQYRRIRTMAKSKGFLETGLRNITTGQMEVILESGTVPGYFPQVYVRLTPKGERAIKHGGGFFGNAKQRDNDSASSFDASVESAKIDMVSASACVSTPSDKVGLFLAGKGGATLLGSAAFVVQDAQMQKVVDHSCKIILEGNTSDLWARNVECNATIEVTENEAKNNIARLVRDLGVHRKSVYGRFRAEEGSPGSETGILVIPYVQSMKNKKGQLECLLEKDIRKLDDCPLEPLPSSVPAASPESGEENQWITVGSTRKATNTQNPPVTLASLDQQDQRKEGSSKNSEQVAYEGVNRYSPNQSDSESTSLSGKSQKDNENMQYVEPSDQKRGDSQETIIFSDADLVAPCNSSSIIDEDLMQQHMAEFDLADLSSVQNVTDASQGDDCGSDLQNEIQELEFIMLSLENSGNGDLDGKSFTDIEIDQALEDLEVMLASFGESESSIVDGSTSLTRDSQQSEIIPKYPSSEVSTTTKRASVCVQHCRQLESDEKSKQNHEETTGELLVKSSLSAEAACFQPQKAALSPSPVTASLTPRASSLARALCKSEKSDVNDARKQDLWWEDVCMESDDNSGDDLQTASSNMRPHYDNLYQYASSTKRRTLESKEGEDHLLGFIDAFCQTLYNELNASFADRAPGQVDFLEVSDMWDDQANECPAKRFAELSPNDKRAVLSVVSHTVHSFNYESRRSLVVRKNKSSFKALSALTIFASEEAAKRRAATFRKTKLCRFWPACGRGDECPYAHGLHELVLD